MPKGPVYTFPVALFVGSSLDRNWQQDSCFRQRKVIGLVEMSVAEDGNLASTSLSVVLIDPAFGMQERSEMPKSN